MNPEVWAFRHAAEDMLDPTAPMCQCGHTRASHGPALECWGCVGEPCDAPGVTVKLRLHSRTWQWNLRCSVHGSLHVNGPIEDWEPTAVSKFRREHAGHGEGA